MEYCAYSRKLWTGSLKRKMNFNTQVLTTREPDIAKWRGLVTSNPRADIYFTPEFAMTFERSTGTTRQDFGGEALLFFYGNQQNNIIYPFFKRPISELPFSELLPLESRIWFDIISPYGYSGPLSYVTETGLEHLLWTGFLEEFHNYCVNNDIVAEFVRLHPYIKNHLSLQDYSDSSNLIKRSEVVYVDLEQDEALIWKNLTKGHKSSISKARRSGVEIRSYDTTDQINAFYQLYTATMERNRAKDAYFFSREFINDTVQLLEGKVKLYCALYDDKIIAASLFLFFGNLAHYYLSGSDVSYLSVCPNNLMLWEVIQRAKEQGYKIFNLGGGYSPNDSLFHFKSFFSTTTADFYTFSKVHNAAIYEKLCQSRERYAELKGEVSVQSDYFPGYRR